MTVPAQIGTTAVIVDPTTPQQQLAIGASGAASTNLAQVAGSTAATGHGTAAGSLRVELPTDGTGVVGLNAGSNIVGKVGIDQTTPGTTDSVTVKSAAYSSKVTLTRTADTNAYAANDVLGAATGSTAALTFASIGPSAGGEIMITTVSLEIDAAAVISGETSYRLYLYNVTPPSALGDNAAWDLPAGDRASFIGYVDLGTPVDLGSTLYVQTAAVNKQTKLASGSLFGYLTTVGAYTPTSARVYVIDLHSQAV